MLQPKERLIVALDGVGKDDVAIISETIGDSVVFYKVGLQLFLAEGRTVIDMLKRRGARVFLDLKLHDIPHQVARACREIAGMGVDMMTIHTMGGVDMMEAAALSIKESADEFGVRPPLLVGVTMLTSLNQERAGEIGIKDPIAEQVKRLAVLAQHSGLDGVVASPLEVEDIRGEVGDDFVIVTPGIRAHVEPAQDQKRVMSAGEAVKAGASYLVVGRPILMADDPAKAAADTVAEIERALRGLTALR